MGGLKAVSNARSNQSTMSSHDVGNFNGTILQGIGATTDALEELPIVANQSAIWKYSKGFCIGFEGAAIEKKEILEEAAADILKNLEKENYSIWKNYEGLGVDLNDDMYKLDLLCAWPFGVLDNIFEKMVGAQLNIFEKSLKEILDKETICNEDLKKLEIISYRINGLCSEIEEKRNRYQDFFIDVSYLDKIKNLSIKLKSSLLDRIKNRRIEITFKILGKRIKMFTAVPKENPGFLDKMQSMLLRFYINVFYRGALFSVKDLAEWEDIELNG